MPASLAAPVCAPAEAAVAALEESLREEALLAGDEQARQVSLGLAGAAAAIAATCGAAIALLTMRSRVNEIEYELLSDRPYRI